MTDSVLAAVAENCPHLRELKLDGSKPITGAGLMDIAKLKKLTLLDVWGCYQFTTLELKTIIAALPYLTSLDLSQCNVDDTVLTEIAKLTNLAKLDLSGCKTITPVAITVFHKARAEMGRLKVEIKR